MSAADQWMTVDRDWTVVDCGDGAPGVLAQSVGMNLWEAFPGAEDHFRPIYETAWKTGHAAGVACHSEIVTQVFAIRRQDVLLISFEYLTVTGLREVVDRLARQERPAGPLQHPSRPAPSARHARHLAVVQ